jgi:2-methylcitrate dehydratase
MTDSDFERKFRRMASPHLEESAQAKVLGYVAELQHQSEFTSLFAAMVASV